MSRTPLVTCREICKSYSDGEAPVRAIEDVSFEVCSGEVTAVVGPSGSGKTTLLHLCGGVEPADSGEIVSAGENLSFLNATERTAFRAEHVSFVFAEMNLIPVVTAYENVSLGVGLLSLPEPEAHRRITEALRQVDLAEKAHRLPGKLSSGEQQRVAVARAIARRSAIIIADEPTAHLDHKTALNVVSLLKALASDAGSCVILATHDNIVAECADTIVTLEDGRRAD